MCDIARKMETAVTGLVVVAWIVATVVLGSIVGIAGMVGENKKAP